MKNTIILLSVLDIQLLTSPSSRFRVNNARYPAANNAASRFPVV